MDDPKRLIFVGFEITKELGDALSSCVDRDKIYLEDPNHLERVVIDGCDYIGKRANGGIAIDRLEDVARSVVSLINRVSGDWSQRADSALIIAAEDVESSAEEASSEDTTAQEGFDYSGLVD